MRDLVPADSASLPAVIPTPPIPPQIGEYEIKSVLGTGASGRVLQGYDPKLDRCVAIKMPKDPLSPDEHQDFLKEARIVALLYHPNICPVYGVGVQDGFPYIVMRFVSGGTLNSLLACGPLTPGKALQLTGLIANALEEAHAHGVFHRDLKPANVLYNEVSGELLLTDFGIARWLGSSTATTGGVKGTPAYMAPEQWGPEKFGEISARTDVYCLGVVLFRLLTSVQLFPGNPDEQMFAHCFDTPRKPSEVRPDLDPRLDALCLKALAKQQSDRFQSAKAFADAINEYLNPSPPPPPPPPMWLAIATIVVLAILAIVKFGGRPESHDVQAQVDLKQDESSPAAPPPPLTSEKPSKQDTKSDSVQPGPDPLPVKQDKTPSLIQQWGSRGDPLFPVAVAEPYPEAVEVKDVPGLIRLTFKPRNGSPERLTVCFRAADGKSVNLADAFKLRSEEKVLLEFDASVAGGSPNIRATFNCGGSERESLQPAAEESANLGQFTKGYGIPLQADKLGRIINGFTVSVNPPNGNQVVVELRCVDLKRDP